MASKYTQIKEIVKPHPKTGRDATAAIVWVPVGDPRNTGTLPYLALIADTDRDGKRFHFQGFDTDGFPIVEITEVDGTVRPTDATDIDPGDKAVPMYVTVETKRLESPAANHPYDDADTVLMEAVLELQRTANNLAYVPIAPPAATPLDVDPVNVLVTAGDLEG